MVQAAFLWLRSLALCSLVPLAAASSPARAAGPEQLEQLEPEGGEWQVEYSSLIGLRSVDEHSLQVMLGINDRVAVGIEVETEWSDGKLTFEGAAPTLLYRFSEASDAVGIGVGAQVEFDRDLKIASTEARLILEKKTNRWWGQGNLIARHERDEGESGASLAYAWGLSRSMGKDVWIGAEGSGLGGRLSRPSSAIRGGGHFIGPAFAAEHEIVGSEVEIGVSWLHRIAGEGPRDAARLFIQFDL